MSLLRNLYLPDRGNPITCEPGEATGGRGGRGGRGRKGRAAKGRGRKAKTAARARPRRR
jgi:hypothetical protein